MFINFAKKLFEILVADEFSYIKSADGRLVYETEVLSLYKERGKTVYIASIIDAEKISREKLLEFTKAFSSFAANDGGVQTNSQVILLNIIVNDFDGALLYEEDYLPGKSSYIFSYNVKLNDEKLLTMPEGQPSLLKMDKKIKEALSDMGSSYVCGTDLESLESALYEKYLPSDGSKNIHLTLSLILLNVILWLLMELSGGSESAWTLVNFGAASHELIFGMGQYYRLFTANFLHIGLAHLANNCLALYIYGSRIERLFGKLWFIVIYLTAGISGVLAGILFIVNISAGASGAIFGLLGAILTAARSKNRSIEGLSPYLIIMLSIFSIGMGFILPGVNNLAHIAGFAVGMALGRVALASVEASRKDVAENEGGDS